MGTRISLTKHPRCAKSDKAKIIGLSCARIHLIFGDVSRSVLFCAALISKIPALLAMPDRLMAITDTASRLARGKVCVVRVAWKISVVQPPSVRDCTTQTRTSSDVMLLQLTV